MDINEFSRQYFQGNDAPKEEEVETIESGAVPAKVQAFLEMCKGKWTPVEYFCLVPIEEHRQVNEVDAMLRAMKIQRVIPNWLAVINQCGLQIKGCIYKELEIEHAGGIRGTVTCLCALIVPAPPPLKNVLTSRSMTPVPLSPSALANLSIFGIVSASSVFRDYIRAWARRHPEVQCQL